MDVIPLEAHLVGDPRGLRRARAAIAEADVVMPSAAQPKCIHGVRTPAFEESVQLGKQVALRTVRIGLSDKPGELDRLVAVVRAIKRGQDYVGE
jgi:hypothetical protein